MTSLKSQDQIRAMREGGRKLACVLQQVLQEAKLGVALWQLDSLAEELIKKQGGEPSFKTVRGYHWTTCININEGVVHGIPGKYQLKENDLVSLDIGILYQGLHTDMSRTVRVKEQENRRVKEDEFLQAGERALKKAISAAKAGNRVGHISQAIEKEIRKAGFSPIEVLTGHGVGKKLHEDPLIPCLLMEEIERTPLLENGMTLAIEVIYAQGNPEVVLADDGWTIETADGKLSGLFEDTIAISQGQTLVLTSPD